MTPPLDPLALAQRRVLAAAWHAPAAFPAAVAHLAHLVAQLAPEDRA